MSSGFSTPRLLGAALVILAAGGAGFLAYRAHHSEAPTLTAVPNLAMAAMDCHYRFTATNGLPPREDRVELVFAADGTEALQIRTQGSGLSFANADALSEYLLGPVFTGRPR